MNGNWMQCLVKTYDECIADPSTRAEKIPLTPVYHTLNYMHVTVTLDEQGNFLAAEVVPKERQNTIIPCTEDSAGRTSGIGPHPLDDKLVYLARDFFDYAVEKKAGSGKSKKDKKSKDVHHEEYLKLLTDWCESEYSNPKASIVLSYVRKGTLMADLVKAGVLITDEEGMLKLKSECSECPLFTVAKMEGELQQEAFVRWAVDIPGDRCKNTWDDEKVSRDWISFVRSIQGEEGLCYITGEFVRLARNNPSRIRSSVDKAKIISSNDKEGFTFRGRFVNASQAYGIGYEQSQKMHSALRWIIGRQGYLQGDLCIVSWTTSGDRVRSPADDVSDIFDTGDDQISAWTNAEAAKHLNQKLRGYNSKILDKDVMIIALDSASQGRMAVTMFRRELGEDIVSRLESWHVKCAWAHKYVYKKGEDGKNQPIVFVGAPAPKDIATAAYGMRADDKIVSNTIKRMLPCIMDGSSIPRDIVECVVRRACNPVSMETWEWLKTLSIACSLYKGYTGGKYNMVLEKDRTSRDYLYGRLLAMADLMESAALKSADEKRQTTAVRLMQRFSEFPYSTWKNIELALVPYAARLGSKAYYYQAKISEIMDMFDGDDFRNDSKLSGEFLLAYHCQREEHFRKKETEEGKEEEEEEE